ncbi:uncharacterized protein ARMOST_18188 [Armillaria ostoyae]|uniref:Uncharacterized protein n=1 Tax=Armillaria ostoyae TaxID=47428 RepID=A0A284S140_ARMOS|nr:uncharacterized protein ARMOST_18188 [Armillaria ostoyae]
MDGLYGYQSPARTTAKSHRPGVLQGDSGTARYDPAIAKTTSPVTAPSKGIGGHMEYYYGSQQGGTSSWWDKRRNRDLPRMLVHPQGRRIRHPTTTFEAGQESIDGTGLEREATRLLTGVEQSCLRDIDSFLASSAKTPFLRHRSDCTTLDHDVPLQRAAVSSFHSYLKVPIPAHRKAVVRLLTSSHTLAIDVFRWSERRRPPIPRAQRLCPYCQTEVEDEVHVLLYCDAVQSLQDLRREFFSNIFAVSACTLLAALRLAPSGLDVVRTFVDADDEGVLCRFAKYVYDIFHIFNEAPLYCP